MAVSGAISMDPELASWALTADNYLSGARNSHSSPELSTGCWGPAPSHGSLGSGTTYLLPQQAVVPSVPSHPPTGGSSQCLLFFPQDSPEAGGEREEDQEREEEQAFLVSLYKFMKERHTPIERVPHLGFKQSASLGCRQGGGARQGIPSRQGVMQAPPLWATLGDASPQGLHTERAPPTPGTGLQWVGPDFCPHWPLGPQCLGPGLATRCHGPVWVCVGSVPA